MDTIHKEYQLQVYMAGAERHTTVTGAQLSCLGRDGLCVEKYDEVSSGESITIRGGVTQLLVLAEGFCDKVIDLNFMSGEDGAEIFVRLIEDRPFSYAKNYVVGDEEAIVLSVHSPRPYRAELYRLGIEKELVEVRECETGVTQQVPDLDDIVSGGLGWKETDLFEPDERWKYGLYAVRIVDFIGQEYWSPLIVSSVRAECRENKILVLASDTTWQAYNTWGGRSKYRNLKEADRSAADELARLGASWPPKRRRGVLRLVSKMLRRTRGKLRRLCRSEMQAQSLSEAVKENEWLNHRRPFTYQGLERKGAYEPHCGHLAGAEWTFLAWLEGEGICYDYASCAELEKYDLKGYSMVVLNTHNEYWSDLMASKLSDFLNKEAGALLAVGGNQIYRRINIRSGYSIRYAEEFEQSEWDETSVLGTRHTAVDFATCASYKVVDAGHSLFDGCEILGGFFAEKSLNCGLQAEGDKYDGGRPGPPSNGCLLGEGGSGWETDKWNEQRVEFHVLARGQNQPQGADLVFREPVGSQGAILNFSSMTASGAVPVDPVMQNLVKNFIFKYGGGL